MTDVNLLNPTHYIVGLDNDPYIKAEQEITQDFLDRNKRLKDDSLDLKGDWQEVASIPTAVVDKWIREGFNILQDTSITAAQIIARLQREDLDAFITTKKRV